MWNSRGRLFFRLSCCAFALSALGCALGRSGLRPSTYCNVTALEYAVDPAEHTYRFSGTCEAEGQTASYELLGKWTRKPNSQQSRAVATMTVHSNGQSAEANFSANCTDDPLITAVACTNRAISGSFFQTQLGGYYFAAFESNPFPQFFSEAQKAVIRAEADWQKAAPILLYPTQSFRYHSSQAVFAIQLPFAKGDLDGWRVMFTYRLWDRERNQWGSWLYETIFDVYKSSAQTYVGSKILTLEEGNKYMVGSVWAEYKELWETGWFETPTEFFVGQPRIDRDAFRDQAPVASPQQMLIGRESTRFLNATAGKNVKAPLIVAPKPGQEFVAPADIAVKAEFGARDGSKLSYGLGTPLPGGGCRITQTSPAASFKNLKGGQYCVRVAVEPLGTPETFVTFSVREKIVKPPAAMAPKKVTVPPVKKTPAVMKTK